MKNNLRYVLAGAALGAILGALAGLIHMRATSQRSGSPESAQQSAAELDLSQIARLGLVVLGAVRQILTWT